MIKNKELMLGNWVLAGEKTQFPMQVVGIFSDVVYLDFEGNEGDVWEEKEEDLFPIPLTEELLEKNGFIKGVSSNPAYYKDKDDMIYISLMTPTSISVRISSQNGGERVSAYNKIKYLHELQNILTLAGIEIDFKV